MNHHSFRSYRIINQNIFSIMRKTLRGLDCLPLLCLIRSDQKIEVKEYIKHFLFQFNPSWFDDSQESETENEENVKKSENFDINSIINDLYKEDKRKSTMKRKPSEDFYMQENSHDRPLKKRLASGNNGGTKFLTKAALKYSNTEGTKSPDEMKSLVRKEEAVSNYNISIDNNSYSSKNDSPNKSDIIDESPQAAKEKDSKKTKVLGKIFVSTPDRRRSAEHKSEVSFKIKIKAPCSGSISLMFKCFRR